MLCIFKRNKEEINFVCCSMIDYRELMCRVDGNTDLLKQIIKLFLKTAPVLIMRIEEGIRSNNGRQVQHAAHLLKGMISNFAAHTVTATAKEIEENAKCGDLSKSVFLLQSLKEELTLLDKDLDHLANEKNPACLS